MKIDALTQDKLKRWFPAMDMRSVTLVHGGPFSWLVKHVLRQGALAFPPYIFYGKSRFDASRNESVALLAHELMHVQQYRRLGRIGFLFRYFLALSRGGFRYSRSLPLEQEAYDLQDEVLAALRNDV